MQSSSDWRLSLILFLKVELPKPYFLWNNSPSESFQSFSLEGTWEKEDRGKEEALHRAVTVSTNLTVLHHNLNHLTGSKYVLYTMWMCLCPNISNHEYINNSTKVVSWKHSGPRWVVFVRMSQIGILCFTQWWRTLLYCFTHTGAHLLLRSFDYSFFRLLTHTGWNWSHIVETLHTVSETEACVDHTVNHFSVLSHKIHSMTTFFKIFLIHNPTPAKHCIIAAHFYKC